VINQLPQWDNQCVLQAHVTSGPDFGGFRQSCHAAFYPQDHALPAVFQKTGISSESGIRSNGKG
jgi:hypothetical protein